MLGFHVSKSMDCSGKKVIRTLPEAIEADTKLLTQYGYPRRCAQIFVTGPQSFHETMTNEEKISTRKIIRDLNIAVVIHGSYVDNPWNRAAGSIHNIKTEMNIALNIGAGGVIVHLGAGAMSDDTLQWVFEQLSTLTDSVKNNVILWLEIHAAKPCANTYETPAKIRALFARIAAINIFNIQIGLCIDTAHLYSCGVALDTYEKANAWLSEIQVRPLMIHLNDSASELASGRDIHAQIFTGNIWMQYHPINGALPVEDSGLVAILNFAEENNIMTIIERDPSLVSNDLAHIQQLGYFQ